MPAPPPTPLTEAIGQGAAPAAVTRPTVQWIDVRPPSNRFGPAVRNASANPPHAMAPAQPDHLETRGAALTSATIHDTPEPELQQASYVESTLQTPAERPQTSKRSALLGALRQQVRDSDEPEVVKALNTAALSLLADDRKLPSAVIDPLDRRPRELVRLYQRMLVEVADQIAKGSLTVDTTAIVARLEALFGDDALIVRRLELCLRVDGYGVYEPFPSKKFLNRRDRKMVVYVELDHFKAVPVADGRFEVRLAQDIRLYNDADGLEVWRLPAETIRDLSRNRRRDFYTVKLIEMPPDLGVGKYRLKVRLTDLNGGTEAESAVEVQFVADEALVAGNDR